MGNILAISHVGFYEPIIWNVLQLITYVLSLPEIIETQTLRVNVGQVSLGMSTGLYTPQLDPWFMFSNSETFDFLNAIERVIKTGTMHALRLHIIIITS